MAFGNDPSTPPFRSVAGPHAYVGLAGVWFGLAAFWSVIWARHPASNSWQAVSVCIAVGIAWVAWLRGFYLVIDKGLLTYRDGMYRKTIIPLTEVVSVQQTWVRWGLLPARVKTPRLAIETRSGTCLINMKPFSAKNAKAFRDHLATAARFR
jgi:hypothetical protein